MSAVNAAFRAHGGGWSGLSRVHRERISPPVSRWLLACPSPLIMNPKTRGQRAVSAAPSTKYGASLGRQAVGRRSSAECKLEANAPLRRPCARSTSRGLPHPSRQRHQPFGRPVGSLLVGTRSSCRSAHLDFEFGGSGDQATASAPMSQELSLESPARDRGLHTIRALALWLGWRGAGAMKRIEQMAGERGNDGGGECSLVGFRKLVPIGSTCHCPRHQWSAVHISGTLPARWTQRTGPRSASATAIGHTHDASPRQAPELKQSISAPRERPLNHPKPNASFTTVSSTAPSPALGLQHPASSLQSLDIVAVSTAFSPRSRHHQQSDHRPSFTSKCSEILLPKAQSFGLHFTQLLPQRNIPLSFQSLSSEYPAPIAIVAATVAFPSHMLPGTEPMGAPTSFTARRPNASNLPQFELPPPQLPAFNKYPHSFSAHPHQSTVGHSGTLTSVGNLLTPPSGSSSDGLSPTSSAPGMVSASSTSSQSMAAPYTPGAYSWQQGGSGPTPLGFHTAMSPSAFSASRAPFSPSLSSGVKNVTSPGANDYVGQAGAGAEVQSYSMSAPVSLPSMPSQHHMSMAHSMGSAVSQASPIASQDAFVRPQPPPTPTHYGPHSASPAQTPFTYSAGPSPIQHSPVSAAGHMSRMSPGHAHGQIPPIHSQSPFAPQRPFSYSLPGPILSNMGNPGGQMALVGGMPNGMVGYNSGHLAQMQHLYGHAGAAPGANSDRPFKCDQCPQSFNRNHDLKRHKRIHLAVKPFPCGHCDKSFSRKDALKRHILVKGCGKSQSHSEMDKHSSEGSASPTGKSDMTESSPIIAAPA
ncbi:hypothetical protein K461DRAFT_310330 [Myriangium duriaei CBS 260.36]|uniref:C2H2-type domain-containing protein n=1 Tax=Myriangium duriaei CBS 260.36 TaxID=1168546 RepID=A0A9P4J5Y2_9PEZI|nr:hypothetical protein K461DRAFT_310330 [Myriangium duriaei CBS 260.36]